MKTKLIRITTQLEEKNYQKIREIAYKNKVSVATIIREAAERYIKKNA